MYTPYQIFFGGSDEYNGDYSLVHRRAKTGASVEWEVLKHTREGDHVLIYFNRPHSAIVASAVALEDAWVGRNGSIRGRIGSLKILKDPITFDELWTLLPKWAWLNYPRSKVYLDEAKATTLWKRAEGESSVGYRRWRNVGAGFGDPETNRIVEKAAIRRVTRLLTAEGYSVASRESENLGYDLDAKRDSQILHVEVKGVAGTKPKFPITVGEVNRAKEDPRFRLFVVTEACDRSAQVHRFNGTEFVRDFGLRPISFMASQRPRR